MHLNWGGLHGMPCKQYNICFMVSRTVRQRFEYAEVSSSRSTVETYESRWRKGLDGCKETDRIYQNLEKDSCSKEVACWRVGWKPRG